MQYITLIYKNHEPLDYFIISIVRSSTCLDIMSDNKDIVKQ